MNRAIASVLLSLAALGQTNVGESIVLSEHVDGIEQTAKPESSEDLPNGNTNGKNSMHVSFTFEGPNVCESDVIQLLRTFYPHWVFTADPNTNTVRGRTTLDVPPPRTEITRLFASDSTSAGLHQVPRTMFSDLGTRRAVAEGDGLMEILRRISSEKSKEAMIVPDHESQDSKITERRVAYEQAERAAAERAAAYRTEKSAGADAARLKSIEKEVNSHVTEAFDLRQRWQAAEIAEARRVLLSAEVRFRHRNVVKDDIVHRRVKELLSGVDLSWYSPSMDSDKSAGEHPDHRASGSLQEDKVGNRAEADLPTGVLDAND